MMKFIPAAIGGVGGFLFGGPTAAALGAGLGLAASAFLGGEEMTHLPYDPSDPNLNADPNAPILDSSGQPILKPDGTYLTNAEHAAMEARGREPVVMGGSLATIKSAQQRSADRAANLSTRIVPAMTQSSFFATKRLAEYAAVNFAGVANLGAFGLIRQESTGERTTTTTKQTQQAPASASQQAAPPVTPIQEAGGTSATVTRTTTYAPPVTKTTQTVESVQRPERVTVLGPRGPMRVDARDYTAAKARMVASVRRGEPTAQSSLEAQKAAKAAEVPIMSMDTGKTATVYYAPTGTRPATPATSGSGGGSSVGTGRSALTTDPMFVTADPATPESVVREAGFEVEESGGTVGADPRRDPRRDIAAPAPASVSGSGVSLPLLALGGAAAAFFLLRRRA